MKPEMTSLPLFPDITKGEEYLLAVFDNTQGLYATKNLWYYYEKLLRAPNAYHGYHNFRHMCHVTCEMYDAAIHYGVDKETFLVLLLAGIFHDMGHTGEGKHPDIVNINIALYYAENDLLPEHQYLFPRIATFIKATQFPHASLPEDEEKELLLAMRDADMSQSLFVVWQQQVLFGMGQEQHKTMEEMLKGQEYFLHRILEFHSVWGKSKFDPKRLDRLKTVTFINEKVFGQQTL